MTAIRESSELVLEATGRPAIGQALRELVAFRGTILAFAERDVRVKYKQAVLGVAWALIQPLAFLAIFALFFGRLAKIGGDGVPYAVFALTALVPWNYVATTVSFGSAALLNDASLVRKGTVREANTARICSTVIVNPRASSNALRTAFSSSRTFPGQPCP